MNKEQKWVLLDFGELGLDIVETQFVEFPKDARHKLNNEWMKKKKDDLKQVTYQCKNKNKKGQQTAKRCEASIIMFGESKADLKEPLEKLLNGKEIDAKASPLGRGKRQGVKSCRYSSSEDEEDEGPVRKRIMKEKEKTVAEKEKATAEKIMDQLIKKTSSLPKVEEKTVKPTSGLDNDKCKLMQKISTLESENRALRNSIAIMKDLPTLLDTMKKAIASANSTSGVSVGKDCSPSTSPSPRSITSASSSRGNPRPTCIPSTSSSPSASLRPISSPEPPRFTPLQRDLKTSSGEVLVSQDQVGLFASANPRSMVNDILMKVFGREMLVAHSLSGTKCNLHKDPNALRPALPEDKVTAIRDFVRASFAGYTDSQFNKHASEKMSNLRKKGKKKVKKVTDTAENTEEEMSQEEENLE